MDSEFLIETSQNFVYKVLGGAGAVWGSAEIVYLRNQHNRKLWRGISGSVGLIFFGFYLKERIDTYNKIKFKKLKYD